MAARDYEREYNAKIVKAKLNADVEIAIQIMKDALRSDHLSVKDKFKVANDYLAWFFKLDEKIQRDEEFKESMKFKKLKNKALQNQIEQQEQDEFGNRVIPLNQPKFEPFMSDDENPS